MTTTCDDGTERQAIDAGLGVEPAPEAPTIELVGDEPLAEAWTLRRDCDVHTAIVRGLAQYVWSMRAAIGRSVVFGRVTEEQADAWDEAMPYPVAAVYAVGDGAYVGPVRTPVQLTREALLEPDGQAAGLFEIATYTHGQLVVDVTCDSKPQRAAVAAALEDMFSPNLSRGGFTLRLGHYHGAAVRYALTAQGRETTAPEASASSWPLRFRLAAQAPLIRVHRRPLTTIRVVPIVGTAAIPPA